MGERRLVKIGASFCLNKSEEGLFWGCSFCGLERTIRVLASSSSLLYFLVVVLLLPIDILEVFRVVFLPTLREYLGFFFFFFLFSSIH